MSDTKMVSPLLDGFALGEALSEHNGVHCYPAMKENSDNRYIVKTIAVPSSQKQLDALLLTGAYNDPAEAMEYFREMADDIIAEAELLKQLSSLEGFLSYEGWQVAPLDENRLGYHIYLLGPYRQSLEKFLKRNPMTHLGAVNLGLDICSALAICRRSGHIYVDLKPGNIYLTGEREYRIGDLGFSKLSAMKYTSLPSRYCSDYTAPELRDPLATLNPTADTYALGMILYQIYNDGQLPDTRKELPAPANADYELAEIILKACAQNPRKRYQTPIEMGQALVSYMQKNTVNNDPILPPSGIPIYVEDQPLTSEELMDGSVSDDSAPAEEDGLDLPQENLSNEADSIIQSIDTLFTPQEEPPQQEASDDQKQLPDTFSDLDTFSALDVQDDETDEDEDEYEVDDETEVESDSSNDVPVVTAPKKTPAKKAKQPKQRKNFAKGVLSVFLVLLLLAALAFGGYYYYTNYYLQVVEEMNINGDDKSITVELTTDIDETLLTAVCSDIYGNTRRASVNGGVAHFTELTSASVYSISLEMEGFHKLTGAISGSFETKELTTLSDFTAKTGSEDGSVILSFSVDGPESQEWNMTYSAEGVEAETISFTGHMVTITGLNLDTTYTFQLAPATPLYLEGNDTLEFTASKLILAENLVITSLEGTTLTAEWSAPADSTVESWTAHCYSDTGYDATVMVYDTNVTFTELFGDQTYTVEVTAAGMSQSTRTFISAKTTTITTINVKEDQGLNVSWDFVGSEPEGGWLLMYDVDDTEAYEVVKCPSNSGTISIAIPKSTYGISIQTADGSPVFGGTYTYTVPKAKDFDEYSLSASYIDTYLGKTPTVEKWYPKDVEKATAFTAGESVTMVLNATQKFYTPNEKVEISFVIRNAEGQAMLELANSYTKVWQDMWDNYFATLIIPAMPTAEGSYTLELYFNGDFVSSNPFTISK